MKALSAKDILRVCVLQLIAACCTCVAFCQTTQSNQFVIDKQQMSVENGLSSREVYCGVQDSRGFMWLGTRNGLNRYDGKKMLSFDRESHKLQENCVVKMASDKHGKLFILYGQSGYSRWAIGKVDIMDEVTFQVVSLSQIFPNLPFKEADVYWIANDGTERVNIMTKAPYRLWEYTPTNGFRLRAELKEWNNMANSNIVPNGADNYFYNDIALLGFGTGKKKYTLRGTKASVTDSKLDQPIKIVGVSGNNQALCYNIGKGSFSRIHLDGSLVATKQSSSSNLFIDKKSMPVPVNCDSTFIVNIQGKGIFYYNNEHLLPVFSELEIKDYSTLFIFENFVDRLGNIWICSSVGVFKTKIGKSKFEHHFTRAQQSLEVNNQARGIWVGPNGHVYANIMRSVFFTTTTKKVQSVGNGDIKYAFIEQGGKAFVTGTELYEFLPPSGTLKTIMGASNGKYILSALFLNDSILLLGKTEHVFAFNINTRKINEVASPQKIVMPYRFLKRHDGTIWVTSENGLYLLSPDGGGVIEFFSSFNKKRDNQLPFDNLTDIWEDEKGTIWLTTNGNGFYKWNRNKQHFKHYGLDDGFPSSILYSIEEDSNKNLWIGSENGLVCFSPQQGVMNVYSEKDGLSHNEFNRLSSYKAKDGKMYFGGLNGINAFYPAQLLKQSASNTLPLQVISYSQFVEEKEKLLDYTQLLIQQKKIVLEPDDEFFILEYGVLDYENKIHRYAYKLEGVDKDWTYTTENTIRFSGLPHGNFTLLVKSQTSNGLWSEPQIKIPVTVKVPFYKLPLVQLLAFVVLALLLFLAYRYRIGSLKKDKLQLEEAISNRTILLQHAVEEKELLLKEVHHRVKNNLQIISGLLDLQKEDIDNDAVKEIFNEG